ncbi:MAG TPA: 50S ribosomal protein L11 methyltransferase [Iamia sp.]|nr:50S ribosomal protein L11 methyltransferase [Iamia sp.]
MADERSRCPVCRWDGLDAPAWTGISPSDEICPCCGTQFGYHDGAGGASVRASSHGELRTRWIARGAVWSSLPAPAGWDARTQLVDLGTEGNLVRAGEVRVVTTDVDLVSGLLWGAGVSAVGEVPQPDGTVVLRVDLPPGGLAALEAAVGDRWLVAVATVDDGLGGWREHARVVRAGRIVVWPPWVPLGPVGAEEVVVEIDPGPSFGHGAHPTTRLCLEALDRLGPVGRSVLDVGCGSGVLAIAAVLLGAPHAVAVDIDPAAVEVTRANAERNGVADRIDAGLDLSGVEGLFDIVVANIGAAALRELAPALVARVAPGGTLVLSGLLDPPPADLAPCFGPLELVADERTDGWTALALR